MNWNSRRAAKHQLAEPGEFQGSQLPHSAPPFPTTELMILTVWTYWCLSYLAEIRQLAGVVAVRRNGQVGDCKVVLYLSCYTHSDILPLEHDEV